MLDAKFPAHPVIMLTEPIGSIRRPLRLIEAFSVTNVDPMPEEIRGRILEAVRYIPLEQLGTTETAAFLLSAMTLLPVARRLLQKSEHGLRARRWLRKQLEMDDAA